MGWIQRLLGKSTVQHPEKIGGTASPSTAPLPGSEPDAPSYYTGDPPVPNITALRREATYADHEGAITMMVTSFDFSTDDGRRLHHGRCGITRWKHLGIYVPDVVGESYRSQDELKEVRVGAPARLVPDPANPHDPKAIRVETESGTLVGFIAAKATNSVRRAFTQAGDEPIQCAFLETHSTIDGQVRSVRIVLWRPGSLAGLTGPTHGPLS